MAKDSVIINSVIITVILLVLENLLWEKVKDYLYDHNCKFSTQYFFMSTTDRGLQMSFCVYISKLHIHVFTLWWSYLYLNDFLKIFHNFLTFVIDSFRLPKYSISMCSILGNIYSKTSVCRTLKSFLGGTRVLAPHGGGRTFLFVQAFLI